MPISGEATPGKPQLPDHPGVYIVALPFFALMSFLIAVPTGIKGAAHVTGDRLPRHRHLLRRRPLPLRAVLRSEHPAFELHYPHMIERLRAENHITFTGRTVPSTDAPDAPSEAFASAVQSGDTDGSDAEPGPVAP